MIKLIGYVIKSRKTSRYVYEIDGEYFSCIADSSLVGDELVTELGVKHTIAEDEVCGERWLRLATMHSKSNNTVLVKQ
jgi:hypothetical protein